MGKKTSSPSSSDSKEIVKQKPFRKQRPKSCTFSFK
uniref:Uncharacterized protein n=1 Tax=Arundo donax TaxID=35708 RepID=A0A0A8XVB9_ARUDO